MQKFMNAGVVLICKNKLNCKVSALGENSELDTNQSVFYHVRNPIH